MTAKRKTVRASTIFMQVIATDDGGFICHKLLVGLAKFSAWFDATGTLTVARREGDTLYESDKTILRALAAVGRAIQTKRTASHPG